jgi:hypothetical protein
MFFSGGAIIEQSVYGYDGLGRRQSNQETLSGQTTHSYAYSYDAMDRLAGVANGNASLTEAYGSCSDSTRFLPCSKKWSIVNLCILS